MRPSVPSVRRNIVANFAGKLVSVVVGLVFPPIYARLLGVESYGLIGVYTSLTVLLGILDLGLSATLNREMARLSTEDGEEPRREMRSMVATLGALYWSVGLVVGGLVFALAPLGARWVNARNLPHDVVVDSLRLMGLVFAMQWPMGVYNSGLLGLQRHTVSSSAQVVGSLVRFGGAALVLAKFSRSIQAFFAWQTLAMAFQTGLTWKLLDRSLPSTRARATVRWAMVSRNWRFSGGMSLISLLAIALTQADKVIVSRLVSLEEFGYYTLAWTPGSAIGILVGTIFIAVFPRFTQLVNRGATTELVSLYHRCAQLVAVLVFPVGCVLACFSRDVLYAWSGNAELANASHRVLTAVAIGTAFNAVMNMPYALQLAHGWTGLTIRANLVAVALVVPLVYWLATTSGSVGAAWGWACLNLGYVIVVVHVMHRRLIPEEKWRWYFSDVLLPLLCASAPILALRAVLPAAEGRLGALAHACGAGVLGLGGVLLAVPELRRLARLQLSAIGAAAGLRK